jgi:pimeloyl-ACP methyl ester carboxylesterase
MDAPSIVGSMAAMAAFGAIGVSFNLRGADQRVPNIRQLTPDNVDADREAAFRAFAQNPDIDTEAMIDASISYTTLSSIKRAVKPNEISFRGIILFSSVVKPFEPYEDLLTPFNLNIWETTGFFPAKINGNRCLLPHGIFTQLKDINFIALAAQIDTPLAMIHGEKDKQGSCASARQFFESVPTAYQSGFHEIAGAPHTFAENHFWQAVQHGQNAIQMMVGKELQAFQTTQFDKQPRQNVA